MRMGWIDKHWDKEYADRAKRIIKEMVSPLVPVLDGKIMATNNLQMVEYRARARAHPTPPASHQQSTGFSLGALASEYDLGDMMITNNTPDAAEDKTVDNEYDAYIQNISPEKTDPLKFWEVNIPYLLGTPID